MQIVNHYYHSNKRLAFTHIIYSAHNNFCNCHQLPLWQTTRDYSCPLETLISNPPSGITDVKPPNNNEKQKDTQPRLFSDAMITLVTLNSCSDNAKTPPAVHRDRDRSDQKQSPGIPYPLRPKSKDNHLPFTPDRNRRTRNSPGLTGLRDEELRRNLDQQQAAIFNTLSSSQKKRIASQPNQPMEFLKVCNEIKAKDIDQLQRDLKGSDMKKRNKAQYILVDSVSEEVKRNILTSLDQVLNEKAEKNKSVSPSGSSFDPFVKGPVNTAENLVDNANHSNVMFADEKTDDPAISPNKPLSHPSSPLPDTPHRGKSGRGKGGKGARSQSTLQIDKDNVTKTVTPQNLRRIKAFGKVSHYNQEDFMFDHDPDSAYIGNADKNDPFTRASMLTMQREPGRTEIMKAILQFLSNFCNLQCEPPLRSAVAAKDNIRPPWTIEFDMLETDKQSLTDAMSTLQKYGNKIPCTFTDEHDEPISIDLRFNLVIPRSYDTKDQVTYILRPPRNIQEIPILNNNRHNNQTLIPLTQPRPQMTTKHFELLIRDIGERQDKRCSPPIVLKQGSTKSDVLELTPHWHVARGTTPVMSAESGMIINVQNDNLILTVKTETLREFNSTVRNALPPYALAYRKCPDGSYEPIPIEINLVNTDDFGPGLCPRTRTTHLANSELDLIDFVPKQQCPTCNTKSFACNCCGEEIGKTFKDRNEFHKARVPHPSHPNPIKTPTHQIPNPRINMTATSLSSKTSSKITKGHRSFLLLSPKRQQKRRTISGPASRNSRDNRNCRRHKNWQGRGRCKHTRPDSHKNMTGQIVRRLPKVVTTIPKRDLQHRAFVITHGTRKTAHRHIDFRSTDFRPRLVDNSNSVNLAPAKHEILILNG